MKVRNIHSYGRVFMALLLVFCALCSVLSLQAYAAGERTVRQTRSGDWALCEDGHVLTDYTGIAKNKYGWWRIKKGYVDFDANGVYKNEYGWWYVKDGKVDFDYTGIAKNSKGWWRIVRGMVEFGANGVYKNEYGWYYVKQGMVDFTYTGIGTNVHGSWFIKNGKLDSDKNGTYEKGGVTYEIENGKVKGNGKIIYLTFDDGPAAYTDQLLQTLDKYGVKVTFFVTNAYPSYRYDIKKEYNAGHAVAAHTYTHNYATIYRSASNYWADHEKMQDIIRYQTGHRTSMFRFPGGSSNTVSRRYSRGVMSTLTKQAGQKGLYYYDWNVDSDDAGKTRSSDGVFRNITAGVPNYRESIVLCHDVKPYTVNAMDRTIKWCLEHGYTFRPLQPGGFTHHMRVAN